MTTTNPNSANLVSRINEAVEAKTYDVLADLVSVEQQVDAALKAALDAANQRIQQATVRVAETFGRNLVAVQQNVDQMVSEAISGLLDNLGNQVDAMARCYTMAPEPTPEPVADPNAAFVARSREFAAVAYAARQAAEAEQEANPEPTPEPTPALTVPDASGKQVPWRSQFEAQPTEQETESPAIPSPVAAHAVESAPVSVLPEDDQDQDDEEDGIEDAGLLSVQFDEIEATDCPDGLHERQGTGRKTRYTLVEFPLPGEVYYRKQGRKWLPVRYMV